MIYIKFPYLIGPANLWWLFIRGNFWGWIYPRAPCRVWEVLALARGTEVFLQSPADSSPRTCLGPAPRNSGNLLCTWNSGKWCGGGRKQGEDQIARVSRRMRSLDSVHRISGRGWLKAQTSLLLRKLQAWDWPPTMTCPVRIYDRIARWGGFR